MISDVSACLPEHAAALALVRALEASPSPVEADIALWLTAPGAMDAPALAKLVRYQAKVDVAHVLYRCYDGDIRVAVERTPVRDAALLGLFLLCWWRAELAWRGRATGWREQALHWINSALRSRDCLADLGSRAQAEAWCKPVLALAATASSSGVR